jgi:hypothetical protein
MVVVAAAAVAVRDAAAARTFLFATTEMTVCNLLGNERSVRKNMHICTVRSTPSTSTCLQSTAVQHHGGNNNKLND